MYKKHVDTGKLTHLIIKFYINSFFFLFFFMLAACFYLYNFILLI